LDSRNVFLLLTGVIEVSYDLGDASIINCLAIYNYTIPKVGQRSEQEKVKIKLIYILAILLVAGCGEKHHEHKWTTAENFRVMSPWYSSDDKYKMVVKKDNSFVISDANKRMRDSQTVINGNWTVDEQNKTVSISFNNKSEIFIYFEPIPSTAAILVNGSLESANLHQSWYSFFTEDYDEEPDHFH
jgi:hypothetical protein